MTLAWAPALQAQEEQSSDRTDSARVEMVSQPSPRPAALMPLFASYVALQALDIASTYESAGSAASETNPLVRRSLDSPAQLVAIKVGSTALTIALTNRLSKRHPVAAVLLMVGVNSAYATIVAHNYAVRR